MKRLKAATFAGLAMVTLAVAGSSAWAQTSRTIKIIVPTPPGGGSDIIARQLGDEIARRRGVTIVIENRPGGGNVIGFEAASRAEPDGNTLLLITNAFVVIPHVHKLSYDTLTGFEPICRLTSSPTLLAVNSASPYRSLKDLLDAARAKSGELTLASVGPATPYHIGLEQLKKIAGVNITYVPYAGATPVVAALLGQHVTSMFGSLSNVSGQLKANQLRALAVGTPERLAGLPNVPTFAESYRGYDVDVWFGVAAPAKTPKATLTELIGWFTDAMQSPEIRTKLDAQALYPAVACGDDFSAILRRQYGEYGRIIQESNMRPK